MRIILVRHGETKGNILQIIQGNDKGGINNLNEEGLRQIKKVSKRLKDEKIDIIYSSDLKRAQDTAKEIAKNHNVNLILDKRLRERSWGVLEGKTYEEAEILSKNGDGHWYTQTPQGGERPEEVIKRMKDFFEEAYKKFENKTILIVSHGGSIKFFLSYLFNNPKKNEEEYFHNNTGVTYLKREGDEWEIIKLNCIKHLK